MRRGHFGFPQNVLLVLVLSDLLCITYANFRWVICHLAQTSMFEPF
jgi:hypothetical protein